MWKFDYPRPKLQIHANCRFGKSFPSLLLASRLAGEISSQFGASRPNFKRRSVLAKRAVCGGQSHRLSIHHYGARFTIGSVLM